MSGSRARRPGRLPAAARQGSADADPDADRSRCRARPGRRSRGGADDYLVEPFAVAELVARLRALARRRGDCEPLLSYADLALDVGASGRRGRASDRADRPRSRPARAAAARAGRTVTRERAMTRSGTTRQDNVVDRYITRLRRKLGDPPLIRTIRGPGSRCAHRDPGRRSGARARLAAAAAGRPWPRWRCSPGPRCARQTMSCAARWTAPAHARRGGRPARGVGAGGARPAGGARGPASTRQLTVEVLDARGRILARSLTLGSRLLPTGALAARARVQRPPGLRTSPSTGGSSASTPPRSPRRAARPPAAPCSSPRTSATSRDTTHRLALLLG